MYANGIRKIHQTPTSVTTLAGAMSWAWKCDFECFSFNGVVWVCANPKVAGKRYILTPFTVHDFEV